MLQATPFDISLFTGIGLTPVEVMSRQENVRVLFLRCREQFLAINHRLAQNPDIKGCRLRLPMTENLFVQLQNTPSWAEVRGVEARYRLKASVLQFLRGGVPGSGSPILILDEDTEFCYAVSEPLHFFDPELPNELSDAWIESVGICAFERDTEVVATWVISPGRGHNTTRLIVNAENVHHPENQSQALDIPMMIEPRKWPEDGTLDIWEWERHVRGALWHDARLPFYGPSGQFGFRPHHDNHWHPGHGLTTQNIEGQRGYLDVFGGLWQWEGGRAMMGTPLDGHWNVQLLNRAARNQWRVHLEETLLQNVRLHSYHVNIEADGKIIDYTFDVG